MCDLLADLKELEARALAIHVRCDGEEVRNSIEAIIDATNHAELAHSGSWMGYQSRVYYDGLQRIPDGAFFDRQWGLRGGYSNATRGDWREYTYADIYDHLRDTPTQPTLLQLAEMAKDVSGEIDDIREDLIATIEACLSAGSDDFLARLKKKANKAYAQRPEEFAQRAMPRGPFICHDHTAMGEGPQTPPHVAVRANVQSIRSLFDCAQDLASAAKRTREYLSRRTKAAKMLKQENTGQKVFIGHGRSAAWRELKEYIEDRLELKCDHFNREPTAGRMTVERLNQMLDDACFAFLVLTAEDQLDDGKFNPRLNVVHEAGLFQGRLGFHRAIIVLEDGCEKFSNIDGLTYIPFERDRIKGAFHEISDTLKREGISK